MTTATVDDLGGLHSAVARALKSVVEDGVPVVTRDAEGNERIEKAPASPAYLAAAITFLKNNNITAGKGNADLDALKRALDSKRRRTTAVTPEALDEATELFGSRLTQ